MTKTILESVSGFVFCSYFGDVFYPMVSCGIFVLVAIMWLIPDKRIEDVLNND